MSGTMAEKVWRDHIVSKGENGHNRVQDIASVAAKIHELVPEAHVGIEPTTCRLQGGRSGHLS